MNLSTSGIPPTYRSIDRKQLEEWIVRLAADAAWREDRLYRVALYGMRAAMAAALISLAAWPFNAQGATIHDRPP